MAKVTFTRNLERYIHCPPQWVEGSTVAQALQGIFANNAQLAGYILDDQRRLRKNIAIFVDGRMIKDRLYLSDTLGPNSEVYVLQALSGG